MIIEGINICDTITAYDFLKSTSTVNEPFLIITKVNFVIVDSGSTTSKYDVSFNYSIYDGEIARRVPLEAINFKYTGVTLFSGYTITVDSDNVIQDCYNVLTDYFDSAGVCYENEYYFDVSSLSVSYEGMTYVNSDGAMFCWGENNTGQLGDTTNNDRCLPVSVCGYHVMDRHVAGKYATFGIDQNYISWGWGYGAGASPSSNYKTPVHIYGNHTFCKIQSGYVHTLAIDNNDKLWAWGEGDYGVLGNNAGFLKSTPVAVCGSHTFCVISASDEHSVGIDNNGVAWSWGKNSYGSLGDNTTISRMTPVLVYGGHTFCKLSTGYQNTFAIDNNSVLWSWGLASNGSLGNNSTVCRSTPVAVYGSHTFCCTASGYDHTIAIDDSGAAWSWGSALYGALGTTSLIYKSTPVAVYGSHTFCFINNSGFHSSGAIDSNDAAWSWGYNNKGQLGIGTTISKNTPVRICNITN